VKWAIALKFPATGEMREIAILHQDGARIELSLLYEPALYDVMLLFFDIRLHFPASDFIQVFQQ
jgi:hypothetical protein